MAGGVGSKGNPFSHGVGKKSLLLSLLFHEKRERKHLLEIFLSQNFILHSIILYINLYLRFYLPIGATQAGGAAEGEENRLPAEQWDLRGV